MEPLAGAGLSCIINWGNSQFHANLSFNHQTTEHICNGFTAFSTHFAGNRSEYENRNEKAI